MFLYEFLHSYMNPHLAASFRNFLDRASIHISLYFLPPRTTFIFFWAGANFFLPSREIFPAQKNITRCPARNSFFRKI